MSEIFDPRGAFLSTVDDESLNACTLSYLKKIAKHFNITGINKKETILAEIRRVCPLTNTPRSFTFDELKKAFGTYHNQFQTFDDISNYLTGTVVYETDLKFDSLAEIESTVFDGDEEYSIVDTPNDLKKRVRSLVQFNNEGPPSKKMVCVTMAKESEKKAVHDSFKKITSSLLKNEIESQATVTSLQATVTSLQATVTSLQATVTSLQATVTSLQATVTTLQTSHTTLQTSHAALQDTFTTLCATVSTLSTKANKNFLDHLLSDLTQHTSQFVLTYHLPVEAWSSASEETADFIQLGAPPIYAGTLARANKLKNVLSNLIQDGKLVSDIAAHFIDLEEEHFNILRTITNKNDLSTTELIAYLEGEFVKNTDSNSSSQ